MNLKEHQFEKSMDPTTMLYQKKNVPARYSQVFAKASNLQLPPIRAVHRYPIRAQTPATYKRNESNIKTPYKIGIHIHTHTTPANPKNQPPQFAYFSPSVSSRLWQLRGNLGCLYLENLPATLHGVGRSSVRDSHPFSVPWREDVASGAGFVLGFAIDAGHVVCRIGPWVGSRIAIADAAVSLSAVHSPAGNSKQIITWARPKMSQRHRLWTHDRTYNLDYVSKNLDYDQDNVDYVSNIWIREFHKTSGREATERSREVS